MWRVPRAEVRGWRVPPQVEREVVLIERCFLLASSSSIGRAWRKWADDYTAHVAALALGHKMLARWMHESIARALRAWSISMRKSSGRLSGGRLKGTKIIELRGEHGERRKVMNSNEN